jgi:hypothetical protein
MLVRSPKFGAVAQLGERVNGIHEVRGSIPLGSTKSGKARQKPGLCCFAGRFQSHFSRRRTHHFSDGTHGSILFIFWVNLFVENP